MLLKTAAILGTVFTAVHASTFAAELAIAFLAVILTKNFMELSSKRSTERST